MMRTIRCSGRLRGGVYLGGVCLERVSAQRGVCPGVYPCEQND